MSSSPAPAKELESKPRVQPFLYQEAGGSGGTSAVEGPQAVAVDTGEQPRHEAWEAGRREGERQALAAHEGHLQQMRDSLRLALLEFGRERATYFEKVETEVVELALSIARKVLHREAQVDPLLLAAMVRVALDKIESNTKVVVRVHPRYAADCRSFFASNMEPQAVPEVEEDPQLEGERCLLQTELGTTEIGVDVQLKEIEQGLMDLLAQRPPGKS
jgi:flagellar assembly protein FliH